MKHPDLSIPDRLLPASCRKGAGSRRFVLLVAAGLLLLAGCGSARRGMPVQPPLEVTDPHIAQGRQVFMRYCNGCHPGGAGGLGPALNNKWLPGFAIRFQVRHGLGRMPGFSRDVIGGDDLNALSAYLVTLRRHK